MGSTYAEGVRLDYVRRCKCGRRPEIGTCYKGSDPGDGPFIIDCFCGRDPKKPTPDDKYGIVLPSFMSRSWSKTRVVKNWNAMIARQTLQPKDTPDV